MDFLALRTLLENRTLYLAEETSDCNSKQLLKTVLNLLSRDFFLILLIILLFILVAADSSADFKLNSVSITVFLLIKSFRP